MPAAVQKNDRGHQVGWTLMVRYPGKDWGRRQTELSASHDLNNPGRGMQNARLMVERARAQWSRIHQDAQFVIIPWHYTDQAHWMKGTFDVPITLM